MEELIGGKMDKWMWRHYASNNLFAIYHIVDETAIFDEVNYVISEAIYFNGGDKSVKMTINPKWTVTNLESATPLMDISKLLKSEEQLKVFVKYIFNKTEVKIDT